MGFRQVFAFEQLARPRSFEIGTHRPASEQLVRFREQPALCKFHQTSGLQDRL